MSATHTSDVVILVPDIPYCYFYINALNKTLHFRSLQQTKFMPINLTLRFPPYNRNLGYYCSSELYFCPTSWKILLLKVFPSPEMAQIKTLGTDKSPSLIEQKRKRRK